MKEYIEKINKAETLDELDEIIEEVAFDENLTNEEYCEVYAIGLKKAQEM